MLSARDGVGREARPKKPLFCVPTDELLQAKDDLLSEGGQSLCIGDHDFL